MGSAFTVILNVLKLAQDSGLKIPIDKLPMAGRVVGTTQEDIFLRVAIFVVLFILIRFPGIAIFITRIILGKPEVPANLPRLFRGPRPYDEEDFGKLPGRQKEIDDCSLDIRHKPFYILEGESGCGKSSILNAALMPLAAKKFNVVKCRIADDPFGKLLAALKNKAYGQTTKTATKKAILDALKAVGKNSAKSSESAKPLLVCIDQFEELFVTVPDKVREKFIETLQEAIASGGMRLVIAIRSDFRDLLDKACREIDPKQTVFDLNNYYILKSFTRERTQYIVNEILKPINQDQDPLLEHQLTTFTSSLVDELLRPPRDTRLNPNDEKTVLPVELQTIGLMLESAGVENFSAKKLNQMGGKLGLLREYIEKAKNHVWHKTGVPGKDSLRILSYLISPAQTKWAQSTRAICRALNMPQSQVESVLQSFADKYLVNRLPGVSQDENSKTNGSVYELMHEHLIQILIEAPNPVLQKARDAKERLRFWMDRTAATFTETGKTGLIAKAAGFFKMPIPLFESVKLWRFANREQRRLLNLNIRGFFARLLIVLLPISAWTFWTYTDIYQINTIIADAPFAEAAAGRSRNYDFIENYLSTVLILGKSEQALAAARDIKNVYSRTEALRNIATQLLKAGQTELALTVARDIKDDLVDPLIGTSYHFLALRDIATELAKAGQTELALATARDINAYSFFEALRNIATELAKTGQTELALTVARDIDVYFRREALMDTSYRFLALSNIATELAKTGQTELANSALTEALAAARDIKNAYSRTEALSNIATELAKAGQAELANSVLTEALAAARDIKDDLVNPWMDTYSRTEALSNIATKLAKTGQTELVLAVARDIRDPVDRSEALRDIATELANAENTKLVRERLEKVLSTAQEIENVELRSWILATIAASYGQHYSFRKARTIANECTVPADQLSAYAAILQAYYEMKHPLQKEQETAPADSAKVTTK